MKTLYLIGGTMGVGKTTICQQLKRDLNNSVFLDGDWCWDASPFQVTGETKAMVIRNICYLLNSFIHCSAYENVIFCWVMHEQSIIDRIISELDTESCMVKKISLTVNEMNLQNRLKADVAKGIRTVDVIDRSMAIIPMYQALDTVKIETSNKTIREIVDEIMALWYLKLPVCGQYQIMIEADKLWNAFFLATPIEGIVEKIKSIITNS